MVRTFIEVDRNHTHKFNINPLNRVINHGHVNKIKNQMIKHFDLIPPITVNLVTGNVVDGQHRLLAFQRLVDSNTLDANSTIGVYTVKIKPEEEMESIIDANTTSKTWSLDDFINTYSKYDENYMKLNEFCSTHVLCNDGKRNRYRYGAAMIKGTNSSSNLRNGTFKVTDLELENATDVHDELIEIITILNKPLKGIYFEALSISWSQIRNEHTFKEWIKELKMKKRTLIKKEYSKKGDWDIIFGLLHRAIDIRK